MSNARPLLYWLGLMVLALLGWSHLGQPVPLPDVPAGRYQCLSYAPFRDGQVPYDPHLVIPRWQIEEDLAILAPLTECVRTYSATQGLGETVPVAAKHGLKVLLGTWIGPEKEANSRQIKATLEAAATHPETVRGIVVGNEVLLRRELSAAQLIEVLKEMRAGTRLPVTYADVWDFWLKNPQIADHVDFLTIHILPYWEDEPVGVEQALHHVQSILEKMRAAFPGRTILVGETGWPSGGRSRREAVPGVVEQARFVREFIALTNRQAMPYNLIEAFDQPWKRFQEGTVGGTWGLFDAARKVKFPLTGPVSPLPKWPLPMALGGLFSLIMVGYFSGQDLSRWRWLALCGWGHLTGGAFFWRGHQVVQSSQNLADWMLGSAGMVLMLVAAFSLVPLLGRTDGPWSRALPLGLREVRARWLGGWRQSMAPEERVGLILGSVWALFLVSAAMTALAMVMDGRYRDFPTTLYLVPALAFGVRWLLLKSLPRGTMEAWLGLLLTGCVVAGIVIELPTNREAMVWYGVVLLMSGPLLGMIGKSVTGLSFR
ncbi:MAG: glycoside hydrolase family 17 [Magnetococcales bacterium]|nr:glycoside hydrolase family 17 [Magnetococcales bacterium]